MIEVKMTFKAYLKMRYYIEGCDSEISGLGKVREVLIEQENTVKEFDYADDSPADIENEAYLEIYDVEILPQSVSQVHSSIDQDTLAKFLFNKLKQGRKVEDYKVWWHSHNDMDSFFSAGDIDTIQNSTEFPYLISIVSNQEGDIKSRLDVFKPVRLATEIDIQIEDMEDDNLRKLCQKQIQQKIKTKESIIDDN